MAEPSAPSPAAFALRGPVWLTAALGLCLLLTAGLALATVLASLLSGAGLFDLDSLSGLSTPALAATVLTAMELQRGLRKGLFADRKPILVRAARAWGGVGLAWPLVHGVAQALVGGGSLAFTAQLVPALIGGLAGAAIGAAAAAFAGSAVLSRRA